MEHFDWKHTIRLNIRILKLVGLWPAGDESYKPNLYTLWMMVSIIILQIGHIFFQTANIFFLLDDLQAVTGIVFILLTEMQGVQKAYCLIKNMKMLKQLMITVNSDLFQPKNPQQRALIEPTLGTWKAIFWTLLTFDISCMVFMAFFPILDKTYKEYRLPSSAWYPYNTKTSPQYELTYLFQVAGINLLNITNLNIDALIAALNMYIGAQFDILCDNLRNLHDNKETSAEVNIKLRGCIRHHREILKFADNANRFYNWLLFFQFFVIGISIGLSMFQLTLVVPFTTEFYMLLTYGHAALADIFFYCWFGNEVKIKSSELAYAVFESDWTSLSSEVKSNMITFVLKAQKPLKISALGLFYLSLDTFMKVNLNRFLLSLDIKQMENFDWTSTIRLNMRMLKIMGLWPAGDESYKPNLYTLWTMVSIIILQGGHLFFQTANIFFLLDDLQAVTGIVFVLLMEMLAVQKSYCLIKNMKMLKQLIKCRLPSSAWYPYSTKTSPEYELTYLYQVASINLLNMANLNIDALIAALNMYIGAQFDILCDDLRNLHHNEETSVEVNIKLRGCIHHHREILKFADNANKFYNWVLAFKFFVSGFSIGLSMFQLTLVRSLFQFLPTQTLFFKVAAFTPEFYMLLTYGHVILADIFFYCWFGNEVKVKSSELAYAVFESDWTGLSLEVKSNMITFVLKAQKPLKISALGLFYLSLDTFMK
ncbi:7tm 6 domain containing protein, partial [Asbolus verrucosus]